MIFFVDFGDDSLETRFSCQADHPIHSLQMTWMVDESQILRSCPVDPSTVASNTAVMMGHTTPCLWRIQI